MFSHGVEKTTHDNSPPNDGFSDNLNQIIKNTLSRVKKKYPLQAIKDFLDERKEIRAHDMLAKALGKFIAEVTYIHKSHFDNKHYYYLQPFVTEYRIVTTEGFVSKIARFLKQGCDSKDTNKPMLISGLNYLLNSQACPLPKQMLEKMLGKEMTPLPPGYKIERENGWTMLRRKAAVEFVVTKQLTSGGEEASDGKASGEGQSSSTTGPDLCENETLGEAAAGSGALAAASLVATSVAFAAEKANDHKVSIGIAAFSGICFAVSATFCALKKCKFTKKPSTKLKPHILDVEYKLNPKTFLGIRNLIANGKSENARGLSERNYCRAEEIFGHLQGAFQGTHEKLPDMIPNERERELYVIIAKSFLETHYEMMCEFPEIIAERRGSREKVFESLEHASYIRMFPNNKPKAEFTRY